MFFNVEILLKKGPAGESRGGVIGGPFPAFHGKFHGFPQLFKVVPEGFHE